MSVVSCPACEGEVNSLATRCPGCGADPRLAPDAARADLVARGLPLPDPSLTKPRTRVSAATVWWWSLLGAFLLWAFVQWRVNCYGTQVSYETVLIVACVGLPLLLVVVLAVRFGKRSWPLRRRFAVVALAVVATVILLAPTWAGFFGPDAAVYGALWRPWRTGYVVRSFDVERGQQSMQMEFDFSPHWPDAFQGDYFHYAVLERPRPWLPWIVTTYFGGV
jgi:hypothetical protein